MSYPEICGIRILQMASYWDRGTFSTLWRRAGLVGCLFLSLGTGALAAISVLGISRSLGACCYWFFATIASIIARQTVVVVRSLVELCGAPAQLVRGTSVEGLEHSV